MTEYIVPLYIEDEILDEYRGLMGPGRIDYKKHQIPKFGTVDCWTVEFPDGAEMDIRLCSGDHNDGDPLWTQGILYNEMGGEDCYTEVLDTLETEFTCDVDDDDDTLHIRYTVKVFPESKRPKS